MGLTPFTEAPVAIRSKYGPRWPGAKALWHTDLLLSCLGTAARAKAGCLYVLYEWGRAPHATFRTRAALDSWLKLRGLRPRPACRVTTSMG